MRDCRGNIVISLIPVIEAKLPGYPVRTKINKSNTGDSVTYPYVYISDIFQTEEGSKSFPIYVVDLLIQVVHDDLTDLSSLWADQNAIAEIIQNKRDLILSNNFKLMSIELGQISETEIETDTGIMNIGLIRMLLKVEDKIVNN